MSSEKKIKANQINGKKTPGPKNTKFSRYNATTHALTAECLTELDRDKGYEKILQKLKREKNPVGVVESELVLAAALDLVRWKRARCLEAAYITEMLNPAKRERDPVGDLISELQGPIVDPGMPAALQPGTVQCLVNNFQRYETFFANRLFRILHELERLERMRLGESVPAPTAVDVSVRAETGTHRSLLGKRKPAKAAPQNHHILSALVVDINSPDDKEVSAAAKSEHEKDLPADQKNSAALAPVVVADDLTATAEPAVAPWNPSSPSGPIWSRR